ncbi:MAG: nitrous oxide-stimulated promoter family protein [Desulfitobacteriaceae bacterium]
MATRKRIEHEKMTVESMIKLYCSDHHPIQEGLCSECEELLVYAHSRLSHCKFGEEKPTCGKCPMHCYKPSNRERIIKVMRYAGPKMLLVHPLSAIRHLMDGWK